MTASRDFPDGESPLPRRWVVRLAAACRPFHGAESPHPRRRVGVSV